jgi:glycosyltransferase involved in cell wall biosynthesis
VTCLAVLSAIVQGQKSEARDEPTHQRYNCKLYQNNFTYPLITKIIMKYEHTFTVFTPTFNRATKLVGAYESLQRQTFNDFEWLIVDDGSKDDTKNVVESFKTEAKFPIRYFWKVNEGKPRARNFGVSKANGLLLFTLDDDDQIIPDALQRFHDHWLAIPEEIRDQFAGIAGLCQDPKGNIVGTKYPEDILDSDMISIQYKFKVLGEKSGFQRTDVMKEFPFPEFEGERFITEATVWHRIAQKYKTRFVNEAFRIYEPGVGGLTANGLSLLVNNPRGWILYYNEKLALPSTLKDHFKSRVNYARASFHADIGLDSIIQNAENPLLALVGIPVGWVLYIKDKRAYKKLNSAPEKENS